MSLKPGLGVTWVTLSLRCTVFEIFDLQVYSDLEPGLGVIKVIRTDTYRPAT